jgi:glycosyltransferase involved in cell wall biosynthesis
MHVLVLTPFYPTAFDDAAGCFTAEPLTELQKLGVRSHVIAVQPFYRAANKPSPFTPPATWARYPCLPGGVGLASAGALLHASLISKVRSIHRSEPIDLIHAHAALPCGHAASLLSRDLGVPCVVTVHGLDAYFTRQVHGMAGSWCERVARLVYRSAARVIAISSRVCEQVAAAASAPLKMQVIYNGVDCEKFRPASFEPEQRVVLSVGNLIPIKGHDLALRAFAAVQRQFPDLVYEIIGDGPERARLQCLARDLNIAERVRFLGRQSRDQVAEAMRRCSVFALPSRYEGLGCVYLEAMATEKPVIGCRGQGIEEIIDHDHNGWLVTPNDLDGLTNALTRILADTPLRQRLGHNARLTVTESHTLDHHAANLAAVYRECVA